MHPLTRRHFVTSSLASLGCLGVSHTGAQTPDPVVGLSPPRPAGGATLLWAGTRIVWFGGSATVPGSYDQVVPDHNGQWIDRNTGQPFSEANIPGAAGMGFLVGDLVASGSNGLLIQSTALLSDPNLSGATSITAVSGVVAGPQGMGDFWVAPDQLAAMADRNEPNFRVLRTELVINGRRYRAIRIQTGTANGWTQYAFDLDSGLALSMGSTVRGSPIMRLDPNSRLVTPGAGSTQLVRVQLIGTRHTQLPGVGAVYPPAMRGLRSMTYAGSTRTEMPGIPPVPATPMGQVQYQITANHGSYLEATVRTQAASEATIFIAGVVGSPWMNPNTLAYYGAGHVFDHDPITGLQISAAGRQGDLAVMVAQTRLTHNAFGYNLRNGMLAHMISRTQVGQATVFNELRLVDAR